MTTASGSSFELNQGDNFIVAIDVSASMKMTDTPNGMSRIDYAKEQTKAMWREAARFDTSGIDLVTFGARVDVMTDVTPDKADQDKVGPNCIVVESIYLVSDLRLPPNVVDSINLKIAATQKAEQRTNEIATAEAQAKVVEAEANGRAKSILVEAQAQAEANRLLSQSMSDVLVQYRAIEKMGRTNAKDLRIQWYDDSGRQDAGSCPGTATTAVVQI